MGGTPATAPIAYAFSLPPIDLPEPCGSDSPLPPVNGEKTCVGKVAVII